MDRVGPVGGRWRRALLPILLPVLGPTAVPAVAHMPRPCPAATLPAYAHNDYANPKPLATALALGFRGAEADVYLVEGVLRLGHDRGESRNGAAFESRYLAPLDSLVRRCGALTPDSLPWLLTVELKEPAPVAFDSLVALLGRYPALLTAVEVVLVGWHPTPAVIQASPLRLGRQLRLARPAVPAPADVDVTVRLFSVDYGKTMGRWYTTPGTRRRWLATLRRVKQAYPQIPLRVHNVPVDAALYATLRDHGVDLLGTKSLSVTATTLSARAP